MNTLRSTLGTILIFIASIFLVSWAGFAQVQEKSANKNPENKKPTVPAPKAAGSGAKVSETKPATPPTPALAKEATPGVNPDEQAIRQSADAFAKAYNAHDAKALSELFTLEAEFTDEDGQLIKGRPAIQTDFAETFSKSPKCSIEIDITSVRVLTPHVAIEEGVIRGQPVPDDAPNVSRYVAIHVKADGRWLVASVSDYEAELQDLTPNEHLQQLALMVGDWIDESPASIMKSHCRWDDSGNYLLQDFEVQVAGAISGMDR